MANQFLANQVYLYPSANAIDSGNVNSEHNVRISLNNLVDKPFIINYDDPNLTIMKDSKNPRGFVLNNIELFIKGYYVKINSKSLTTYALSIEDFLDLMNDGSFDLYKSEYNSYKNQYYDSNNTLKPGINPEIINLPRLHLVVTLLTDATNNLKGDYRDTITNEVYNNAVIVKVLTSSEISALQDPYIDLGTLILGTDSTSDPYQLGDTKDIVLKDINKDPILQSELDTDSIYVDYEYIPEGSTTPVIKQVLLQDYLDIIVNKALAELDTITTYTVTEGQPSPALDTTIVPNKEYYRYNPRDNTYVPVDLDKINPNSLSLYERNPSSPSGYSITEDKEITNPSKYYTYSNNKYIQYIYDKTSHKYRSKTVSVKDGSVTVTKYKPKTPEYQYDDKGNIITEEDNSGTPSVGNFAFNDNYNIDKIQERTHVASKSRVEMDAQANRYTDAWDNAVAHAVDSKDTGKGEITCYHSEETNDTKNLNGVSPLIARADHSHDSRYLILAEGLSSDSIPQTVDSKVKFNKSVETGDLTVNGTSTLKGDTNVTGNIEADGTIRGSMVYNAVWNDYAELFLKDDPSKDYTPGTVICKAKGKDTYEASNYSNRRLVVGVVSDSYGHLLGGDKDKTLEENLQLYTPIAIGGRVYVKVDPHSTIEEGDLLSVSERCEGRVSNYAYPESGTIVGKALESCDNSHSKDKILMLVMNM